MEKPVQFGDRNGTFIRDEYPDNYIHFSAHLREEVDLEPINQRLLVTVEEAVQPEGVSIWIWQA